MMERLAVSRRSLIFGLVIAVGLLFLLLLVALARYPGLASAHGTGPAPIFPVWFGSTGVAIAYVLLALYFVGLYLGLGTLGTVPAVAQARAQPWQIGVLLGLVACGAAFLVTLPQNVIPHFGSKPVNVVTAAAYLLIWVALFVAAGVLGRRATGTLQGGVVAGIWCGVVAALGMSLLGIAQDLVLAPIFLHTIWAHDATCPCATLQPLATCETSDDLGYFATLLAALPWVGALFALLGAGVASLDRRAKSSSGGTIPRQVVLIPLLFVVLQALLFAGELIWNFW